MGNSCSPASFCAVPFPTRCVGEIWNLIESVSEGFLTYSFMFLLTKHGFQQLCHDLVLSKFHIKGQILYLKNVFNFNNNGARTTVLAVSAGGSCLDISFLNHYICRLSPSL